MKTIILSVLAGLIGITASAQNKESDKKAIEHQFDAFLNSWNKHDFSDMKNYTTEDVEWVNVVGMHWKGRKEVQFAHQTFHNAMFKNTPLKLNWIDTRFITPDVAICNASTHAGSYTTPGGTTVPEGDDMATMVFVKKGKQWLLTAGENVNLDERAKPGNPVLHMPK